MNQNSSMRRALIHANSVALGARSQSIRSDDLLMGAVLAVADAETTVFEALNIDRAAVLRDLQRRFAKPDVQADRHLELAESSSRMIAAAERWCTQHGLTEVTAEALLLTLIRTGIRGWSILNEHGITDERLQSYLTSNLIPPVVESNNYPKNTSIDFLIVWNPNLLDADEYAELVAAIGDLARASGADGIKRIDRETVTALVGDGVPV